MKERAAGDGRAKGRAGSAALTRKDLERFRDLLRTMRADLIADQEQLEEDAFGEGDLPLERQADPSDEQAIGIDLELLESEGSELREVVDALQRIDGGTFGLCESCGAPVGAERLQAIPFARECVRCARGA